MDWSYIAGFFDGEGCFSISFRRQSQHPHWKGAIGLLITITADSRDTLRPVADFLLKEGVSFGYTEHRVYDESGWQKRTTCHLQIIRNGSIKAFIEQVYPFLILKKPHCEIMMRALKLREELKSQGIGKLIENKDQFDDLRHELHRLARKGPRQLKPW